MQSFKPSPFLLLLAGICLLALAFFLRQTPAAPARTTTPRPTTARAARYSDAYRTQSPAPTRTQTPTRRPSPTPFPTSTATPSPSPTLTRDSSLPESAAVKGMYGFGQLLPLSCEARAAADWARSFDVQIREMDFFNRLPKSDDPEEGFVGSPYGLWGQIPPDPYGVHAAPVAKLLQAYGLQASARRGLSFEEAQAEIAAGRPVIVWVVGHVEVGKGVEYEVNGQVRMVARYEHTVNLIGYDDKNVTILDGKQIYERPIERFLKSWSALENQAIVWDESLVIEPTPTQTETPNFNPAYPAFGRRLKPAQHLRLGFQLALLVNMQHACTQRQKLRREDARPVAGRRFAFRAHQGQHPPLPRLSQHPLQPGAEEIFCRQARIHQRAVHIAVRVRWTPTESVSQEQVAQASRCQVRLKRLLTEVWLVARIGLRANIHQQIDLVTPERVQKFLAGAASIANRI